MPLTTLRDIPDRRFLDALDTSAGMVDRHFAEGFDEAIRRLRSDLRGSRQPLGPSDVRLLLAGDLDPETIEALRKESPSWGAFTASIFALFVGRRSPVVAAWRSSAESSLAIAEAPALPRRVVTRLAREWANRRGLESARQTTISTRKGVRYLRQWSIRTSGSVALQKAVADGYAGLTRPTVSALLRQVEEGLAAGREISPVKIERNSRRQLRRRVERIAESESRNLANQAARAAWDEAADRGTEMRGLDGVFVSRTGEESVGPTLHPNCRCGVRAIYVDGAYWQEWVTQYHQNQPCPRCIAFDGAIRGRE